jgi:hypothetical protein
MKKLLFLPLVLFAFAFAQENADIEQIRYGIRGNIGSAQITPNQWTIVDGGYEIKAESGDCFGAGAFALIPFASIYFVPEVSLESRKPIKDIKEAGHSTFIKLSEMAMDIPMHFRFRYREENIIYLGIGPFLGLVLSSDYSQAGMLNNDKRSTFDFGITMEIGFRINEKFSIDIRGMQSFTSIGFTESVIKYALEDTSTLMQFQIGLNYAF